MKPDITDYRLDRLREDPDIVSEQLASTRELLARLRAQVVEQDAVLTRMCHGAPADLPEGAIFAICIHGKGWSIQDLNNSRSPKDCYWWFAWGSHYPDGDNKNGTAISIPDAMDKIRKAHAELGVTL